MSSVDPLLITPQDRSAPAVAANTPAAVAPPISSVVPATINYQQKPVALAASAPDITNMPPDQSPDQAQRYAALAQQLDSTPPPTYNAPTYKPPNKTGEIVAGLLSVLFPGAPISKIAAGYLQGGAEGAKEGYERAQQAAQQKYTVAQNTRSDLERQEAAAGAALDRQQKQIEDWNYRQQTLALRADQLQETHEHNIATVRSAADRLQQGWSRIGISRSNLARLTTKDQNQVALALTHDALSEDQADRRLAQSAQIAAMNELGRNTRFAQDQQFVNARSKIMAADRAVQSMITAEMNPLNTDPPEVKQQKVQSLLDSFDKTYDTVITPLSAKHPEIGQIADTLTSAAYGTDAYTAAGPNGAPEGAPSPTALYHENGGTGGGSGAPVQSTFGPPPGAKPTMPPPTLLRPLEQLAMRAGAKNPADARALAIVAANESAGNRYAVNPGGTGVGLWQINPEAHGPGNWTDPLTNARKAVQLFYSQGLEPWADSANKGAFGGWSTMVAPQPGPGSVPGADLTAYLTPPPPAATAAKPAGAPTPPAPPANAAPTFEQRIATAVSMVKADPTQFNAIEQGVKADVDAKRITPQQGQAVLKQLQDAMRPAPPPDPRVAAATAAGLTPGTPAYQNFMASAKPAQFSTPPVKPPPAAPAGASAAGMTPQQRAAQGLPAMSAGSPSSSAAAQQSAYAAQVLARVRALPPAQRAAFIAKQPPQLQAYLRAQLATAQTPNAAAG